MSICPIRGCSTVIAADRLMCHSHWFRVSKPLRETIWFLWNNGKPRDGHREACREAIEQVNAGDSV